ncbi:MAG: hypothetical protein KatS3mg057_0235 [Herpetosiphonaceae bacterium]|nr:MAG: hypothetical protein KatS3mg057_0235 [Herpetosiphonaceae bacterium]
MSLCEEFRAIGKRITLAGALALITGWVLVLLAEQQIALWPPLAATLVAALVGGLLVIYQLRIYWPRLRVQLQQAELVEHAPEQRSRPLPTWLAGAWIGLLVLFSWLVGSPFFPILASGLLFGYGGSAPLLARRIDDLQRNRVIFYIERNPETNRRRLIRVLT